MYAVVMRVFEKSSFTNLFGVWLIYQQLKGRMGGGLAAVAHVKTNSESVSFPP